jgi:hypothetical protein
MTRQIINVGVADKGNGDPIRVAFSKANANFAELYNILSNNTGGSIITTDVIGSVFADDSTLLVDGINGSIPYSVLSGAPTIPAAQVQSNWTAASGMGVILNKPTLFSGSYTDLTSKPTIPTLVSQLANDSGFLTSVGNISNIRSEGNINIDINLSDSTLRRWQFGEDGSLTLPGNLTLPSGAGINTSTNMLLRSGNGSVQLTTNYEVPNATPSLWTFGTTGTLTLPLGGVIEDSASYIKLTPAGGANAYQALLIYPTAAAEGDHIHLTAGGGSTELYLGNDFHFVKLTSDGFVVIKADDGVNGAVWGFSPDGTTSIPGNIKSDSNINIEINLSDSTLRRWQFGEDGELTLPVGGDIVDSTGVSQTAQRVEGSWTVTAGTNTYNFTVPSDGTYTMWVKGNIPNGIITWNATLSVTNSNVPAIGYQYAWNYTGGGSPILLTSIPDQIRGTAGTISTDATYVGSTSNRFDFTIANTSGASQTVYYGYTRV